MDIENMPAGEELDKLICEKLDGWRWVKNSKNANGWACNGLCGENCSKEEEFKKWNQDNKKFNGWVSPSTPHFSTDIAAAWEVVEKVRELGFDAIVVMHQDRIPYCQFVKPIDEDNIEEYLGTAETAPLAICRAALKAVTP